MTVKQVVELLTEVKPITKKTDAASDFVEKLRSLLIRMKPGKREHQVIFSDFNFSVYFTYLNP